MDKVKLAKLVTKGVASIIVSTVIGYTYKAGKMIDQRIDDHFAEPEEIKQAN